jgi:hypothetical protein
MRNDKDKIRLLIKLLREANYVIREQHELVYNAHMRRVFVHHKYCIPWEDGYVEKKAPKLDRN